MSNKSVGTSTILGSNSLYVNPKEADTIISNISNSLGDLSKKFSEIFDLLEKIRTNTDFSSIPIDLKKLSKKCSNQAVVAEKTILSLKNNYNDDLKELSIIFLNSRIEELEKKISEFV